jgi:hypothetical protein
MAIGLLLAVTDLGSAPAAEFDGWFDTEQAPRFAALPGFLAVRRWAGLDKPNLAIVTLELKDHAALESAAYRAAGDMQASAGGRQFFADRGPILRFEGRQITAGEEAAPMQAQGLLVVASNADPDFQAEYGDWYDQEHLPALRAVPGTLATRRYRAVRSSHQFLSLYHMQTPEVQASAAWKKATDTPWSAKVRPQVRDRLRFVCRLGAAR